MGTYMGIPTVHTQKLLRVTCGYDQGVSMQFTKPVTHTVSLTQRHLVVDARDFFPILFPLLKSWILCAVSNWTILCGARVDNVAFMKLLQNLGDHHSSLDMESRVH